MGRKALFVLYRSYFYTVSGSFVLIEMKKETSLTLADSDDISGGGILLQAVTWQLGAQAKGRVEIIEAAVALPEFHVLLVKRHLISCIL